MIKTILFYFAKFLQAVAMISLVIPFIQNFPKLMNPQIFWIAITLFGVGWLIEKALGK